MRGQAENRLEAGTLEGLVTRGPGARNFGFDVFSKFS